MYTLPKSRLTASIILLLSTGLNACGSNKSSANQCAQRYGTYLNHYTVRDGNCGPITDQIGSFAKQPTSVDSPCTGSIGYSGDNCTVTLETVCPGAGKYSSYSITIDGVFSWSQPGDSATGVEQWVIQDAQGTNACKGSYDVTVTRQSTTVIPSQTVEPTPLPTPSPTPSSTGPIYTGVYAFGAAALTADGCGGSCQATLPGANTFVVTESSDLYTVTSGGSVFNATQVSNYVSFQTHYDDTPPSGCISENTVDTYTFSPNGASANGTYENDSRASCTSGTEICNCTYAISGSFSAR